jgi:hypothetical protein
LTGEHVVALRAGISDAFTAWENSLKPWRDRGDDGPATRFVSAADVEMADMKKKFITGGAGSTESVFRQLINIADELANDLGRLERNTKQAEGPPAPNYIPDAPPDIQAATAGLRQDVDDAARALAKSVGTYTEAVKKEDDRLRSDRKAAMERLPALQAALTGLQAYLDSEVKIYPDDEHLETRRDQLKTSLAKLGKLVALAARGDISPLEWGDQAREFLSHFQLGDHAGEYR